MPAKPDAFLSYTRFDDQRGKISEFCSELSYAVEAVSGEPFHIFQDVDGIGIGEHWPDKLDDMLCQARFFIPIVTPKFFNSDPCRSELNKFLEQEHRVGRKDLVLPIYWIQCAKLEEPHLRAKDELALIIDERQRWDWRRHRLRPITDIEIAEQVESLAIQIERARRNVLRLVEVAEPARVGEAPDVNTPPSKPVHLIKTKPAPSEPPPTSKESQPAPALWTPGEGFRDIGEQWCPEMVKIPAGIFLMGSPEDEMDHQANEIPQHQVTISQDFALCRFSVTFKEYEHFCAATSKDVPEDRGWGRGRRPVINVSYYDALAYCAWLSETTGRSYRLSTEAEWEYACRAGTTSAYAFGDAISEEHTNFGSKIGKTTEVGAYSANAWGIFDMHGNVWEWCVDGQRRYRKESVTDPLGPANPSLDQAMRGGSYRVLRGGSWDNHARDVRAACRGDWPPHGRGDAVGFRCVRVRERASKN